MILCQIRKVIGALPYTNSSKQVVISTSSTSSNFTSAKNILFSTEFTLNKVFKRLSTMSVVRKELLKSPEDDREYRGLILPNGIKAVLVSDPTTDKSAAALDVNVGSLSDPNDLPGLVRTFAK